MKGPRRYHELKILHSPLFRGVGVLFGVLVLSANAFRAYYLLYYPGAIVTPMRVLLTLGEVLAGIAWIWIAISPEREDDDEERDEDRKPDLRDL